VQINATIRRRIGSRSAPVFHPEFFSGPDSAACPDSIGAAPPSTRTLPDHRMTNLIKSTLAFSFISGILGSIVWR
jgi:hypothetical protein